MTSKPARRGFAPEVGVRDSRTLLPDRDSFYFDMRPLIEDADSGASSLVLIDIDVYGLDFILRTFGPEERDTAVREVGHRITRAAESGTTPYHITQGRFSVVLPNSSCSHATGRARALADTLREPFTVAGISYHLDAFIGISHYPTHAGSLSELVRASVFACHQARGSESQYAVFDPNVDEDERYRFRLMIDLEQALKNKSGIQMIYQPQVELESGCCTGVEALCRWDHSEFGPIPPEQFLPFVEQSPLMLPLTEATLELGLRDLEYWRSRGFAGGLAVNLSPTLFRKPGILERLLEHFRLLDTGMDQVHFEVTETGIMDQPRRAVHTLSELRKRGCQVAVDDFGTGHSSLAYLADLPVDSIKIDMYFVQNLSKPWGRAIVGAAATLADKLGLISIAEGIENESQLRQCRELGVTIGQGFHVARPMFKEELEQWLGL